MRLALVLLSLVSFGAVASPSKTKVPPRKWKCVWEGKRVFCELVDHPLGSRQKDSVRLFDRTAPEFSPLVTAPPTFEPFAERLSGQ